MSFGDWDGGDVLLSSNDAPEVAFDPVNDQLELRAERSGKGDGRVYTITVTATDGSGTTATSTTTVTVDYNQGKKAAKVVAANLSFAAANYPTLCFSSDCSISAKSMLLYHPIFSS